IPSPTLQSNLLPLPLPLLYHPPTAYRGVEAFQPLFLSLKSSRRVRTQPMLMIGHENQKWSFKRLRTRFKRMRNCAFDPYRNRGRIAAYAHTARRKGRAEMTNVPYRWKVAIIEDGEYAHVEYF